MRGVGFRQSKVNDFNEAIRPQHDVAGLEIAMDDAGGMRGNQRRSDLYRDFDRIRGLHKPAVQRRAQRDAVDELTRDVVLAVSLADVIDRQDVGMVEAGGGTSFLLKTNERGGVGGELRG